ncbi:hypothetical protein ACTNDP_22120 [Paenibacillus barengoltzii]|uniref:hypothetical protein n=1 Tax=Paenibacillus barengoltzii TaxID=343517 RepID=UPI003F8881CF
MDEYKDLEKTTATVGVWNILVPQGEQFGRNAVWVYPEYKQDVGVVVFRILGNIFVAGLTSDWYVSYVRSLVWLVVRLERFGGLVMVKV